MLQLLHIMEEWTATLENMEEINTIYFMLILKRPLIRYHTTLCIIEKNCRVIILMLSNGLDDSSAITKS